MNKRKILAALFACAALTACAGGNTQTGTTTAAPAAETTAVPAAETAETGTDVTLDPRAEEALSAPEVGSFREVENEADLAIYKFSASIPEGFEAAQDDKEGKIYASPDSSIIIRAQNYKDQFQDLATVADNGCATIKVQNMYYQADTEFSEPVNTTVAGFDAIRYDYTVKSYYFVHETDAEGNVVTNADGSAPEGEKTLVGEYCDRVYYFFSDEDVYYFICETKAENKDKMDPIFDAFVESVKIN